MKRPKYPPGSPRDVLARLQHIELDVRQQLIDVQSVNDNNPNFKDEPIDVGRYVVQLKKIRDAITKVESAIAAGAEKLPEDILTPLCEMW